MPEEPINFAFDKLAQSVTNECPVSANTFYTTREEAAQASVRLPRTP